MFTKRREEIVSMPFLWIWPFPEKKLFSLYLTSHFVLCPSYPHKQILFFKFQNWPLTEAWSTGVYSLPQNWTLSRSPNRAPCFHKVLISDLCHQFTSLQQHDTTTWLQTCPLDTQVAFGEQIRLWVQYGECEYYCTRATGQRRQHPTTSTIGFPRIPKASALGQDRTARVWGEARRCMKTSVSWYPHSVLAPA